jgi:hypothetical protein
MSAHVQVQILYLQIRNVIITREGVMIRLKITKELLPNKIKDNNSLPGTHDQEILIQHRAGHRKPRTTHLLLTANQNQVRNTLILVPRRQAIIILFQEIQQEEPILPHQTMRNGILSHRTTLTTHAPVLHLQMVQTGHILLHQDRIRVQVIHLLQGPPPPVIPPPLDLPHLQHQAIHLPQDQAAAVVVDQGHREVVLVVTEGNIQNYFILLNYEKN